MVRSAYNNFAMKMKTLFSLSFAVLLTSCTASYKSSDPASFYRGESANVTFVDKNIEVDDYEDQNKTEETIERKIIYNASLTLEVDSSQTAKVKILAMTKEYNGFMVRSNTNSITVRVPSSDLESALVRFKGLGKLVNENQSGQDITEQYFDIQLRLDNAEKSRSRYLELLNKAETVEEILKVEVELERLNEKIERFKGKMKSFNNQVDFSKISVRFQTQNRKSETWTCWFCLCQLVSKA